MLNKEILNIRFKKQKSLLREIKKAKKQKRYKTASQLQKDLFNLKKQTQKDIDLYITDVHINKIATERYVKLKKWETVSINCCCCYACEDTARKALEYYLNNKEREGI